MAKGKACNGNVQSEEPLICERTDMHELSGGSDSELGVWDGRCHENRCLSPSDGVRRCHADGGM